ncbi:polyprotein [Marmot norovirus]|uniref:polyprotein n=1 Tax=Marmot norovirus TaxID=2161807 RepID=UPI000D209A50|nr:polyprotein [Marmot norovirus]AVX29502.1 polyprotein [Marmot norovirus]
MLRTIVSDARKICGAAEAPRIVLGEAHEPQPGTLLEFDEGEMYHYGVYLSHGFIMDTTGLTSNGRTGLVVVRKLAGPWRETPFKINCGVEELFERMPAKVDYDLLVNNCWGIWKQFIPSLPDWSERSTSLEGLGPFHTEQQSWVSSASRWATDDSLAEYGTNTHTLYSILKACLRFLVQVTLKKLSKVKPLNLYHLIVTTRPTFSGVLATLTRLFELYDVPIGDFIMAMAELQDGAGTRGWREALNMILTAFGILASFFVKKPLDWLNGALKRLLAAIKGSKDLATAANKVANEAKKVFPRLLEDHWDADVEASKTLEEVLSDNYAGQMADPKTRQMAVQLAQKTVANLKHHSIYATGDEGQIKEAIQRAESALTRLVLASTDMVPRKQPYVLVLAGPPGCGKTTLASFIARQVATTLSTGIFQLNSDLDHWDSYQNQGVVLWEDFGAVDHPRDCRLLQKLADTAPLTLDCDKIENKGRTFTSTVIIITTNWQRMVPLEYAHPDAVLRRISRHLLIRSEALESWCRRGRPGSPPVQADFSHQTIVGLPAMALDWVGNTIYGRLQPLRTDLAGVLRPLMKAALEVATFEKVGIRGALKHLGLSWWAGATLVQRLRTEEVHLSYVGPNFEVEAQGYRAQVWSTGGQAAYRLYKGSDLLREYDPSNQSQQEPPSRVEELLSEIEAELSFPAASLLDVPRPSVQRLTQEAVKRSNNDHQDLVKILCEKLKITWHLVLRLALKGVHFLLGVVSVRDSTKTSDDIATMSNYREEAKGKTKRGRGANRRVGHLGKHGYRFSAAEYDDFLARRADAKRRGVVYTLEDYLEDIGADEDEPWLAGYEGAYTEPPRILDEYFHTVGWATVDGDRLVTAAHVAKAGHWVWKGNELNTLELTASACEYAELKAGPLRGKRVKWLEDPPTGQLCFLDVLRDGKEVQLTARLVGSVETTVQSSKVVGFKLHLLGQATQPGDCGRLWYSRDPFGLPVAIGIHTASIPPIGMVFCQRRMKVRLEKDEVKPPHLVKSHPLADGTHLWLTPYGAAQGTQRRSGPPALGRHDPRCTQSLMELAMSGLEPFLGPDLAQEHRLAPVVTVQVFLRLKNLVGICTTWDDETAFQHLEKNTSSGYPNYTNKDPKLPHIANTRRRVDEFMAGNGSLHDPVYTAALKDEPYLLEKVAIGKRRLLFCSPFETTMACARMFGPLCESLKRVRLRWPGLVGMKPAAEWSFLVHHLELKDHLVYCADYSRWDSTLPNWLLRRALWVLAKLVAHPKALFLAHQLAEPRWVICGSRKFLVRKGLPSGIPMTSILNCVAHWIASAISLVESHALDPGVAVRHPLAVYGDDEVVALRPDFSEAYFDTMRSMGFRPTGPDKGPSVPGVNAVELEFLSRRTRLQSGILVGALKEESIRRQLSLTRGPKHTDPTEVRMPHAEYVTQLHCALGEASLHGRSFFSKFCDEVAEACRLASIDFDFWTFQAYFSWVQDTAMELEGKTERDGRQVPAGAVLAEDPTPAPLPENTGGLALAPTINPIDPYIFETFVEVPAGTFTIGPDTTTNQVLLELQVGPGLNMYLNHLWQMYAGWSGGFEVQIQVAGNAFVSGKLIFAVIPPGTPLPGNSTQASGFPHVILDLRVADSICLQVPDVKNISFHLHGVPNTNARLMAMAYTQMRATAPTAEFQVEVRVLSRPLPDFAFTMVVPPTQEAELTSWKVPTRPVSLMTNPRYPIGPIFALVADPSVTQVYQQLGRYSFEDGGPLGTSTIGPAQRWPVVVQFVSSSAGFEFMQGDDYDDPFIIGSQPTTTGRWDFGSSTRAILAEYNHQTGVIGSGSLANFGPQQSYGPVLRPSASVTGTEGQLFIMQVLSVSSDNVNTSPQPAWNWPDAVAPVVVPNPAECLLLFHSRAPAVSGSANVEVSCLMTPELFASYLETRDPWPAGSCALLSYVLDGLPVLECKVYPAGFMTCPATTVTRRWDAGGYFTFLRWVNWNYVMTPVRAANSRSWL